MTRSLGFLLLLASCSPRGLAVDVPWLEVSDAVTVQVAYDVQNVVAIPVTNDGTAAAEITATAAPPLVVSAAVVRAQPGQQVEVPLLYRPDSYSSLTSWVVVGTAFQQVTVALTLIVDPDGDGDGHAAIGAGGDDCDDADPTRYPGAPERCDGLDQDCDDQIDEDVADPPAWYPDADGDGYGDVSAAPVVGCVGPAGSVQDHTDCDDGASDVSPHATEVWYDGVDQNCDGEDDFDQDLDGYRSDDYGGDDCDDSVASVHPGATEIWYDGRDQDCDGNDDDQDLDGSPGGPAGDDCDDLDPTVHPGAPELDDGLDQDCDGLIDEGLWVHGTLLFTELMADPLAVPDLDGQYVELYNPTDGDVELASVVVTVGATPVQLSAVVLPPGGLWVLCGNLDSGVNGGVACGDALPWVGGPTTATVVGDGVTLDELSWGGWSLPVGASLELGSDRLDPVLNDDPASWCTATAAYGAGDLGTPGTLATPCP